MSRPLALHFVSHTDDDGHNLDLFVWCTTPRAAIGRWRAYYRAGNDLPIIIYRIPTTSSKPGALRWHADAGVPVVWRRP